MYEKATRRDIAVTTAVVLSAVALEAMIVLWSGATGDHEAAVRVGGSATTGLLFVICGMAARWRTPYARMGWVLVIAGLLWMSEDLSLIDNRFGDIAGQFTGQASAVGFVLAVLAFPTGRLRGSLDRALLTAVAVEAFVLAPATAITNRCTCEPRGLNLTISGSADRAVDALLTTTSTITLAVAVVVFLARWRKATRPERRMVAPLLCAAIVIALMNVSKVIDNTDNPLGDYLPLSFSLGPLAVLLGLARINLVRLGVTPIVSQIGGASTLPQIRDSLRRSLADNRIAIRTITPGGGDWFDEEGRPVAARTPVPGAAFAPITDRNGDALGVLQHDQALAHDPELLEAVVSAIRLALENAALHEAVSAQLTHEADVVDGVRRRVARDLHDGAQQRLVSLMFNVETLGLRLGDDVPPAVAEMLELIREDARGSLVDLRRLVHGLAPATLLESGLGPAIRELALGVPVPVTIEDRLEKRLPAAIESGVFLIVAEALANVTKHAEATAARVLLEAAEGELHVAVSDDGRGGADAAVGSGLLGMRERVAGLGGSFSIASPLLRGTTIGVRIPLDSYRVLPVTPRAVQAQR